MLAAGWLRVGVGQPGVLVLRRLGLWRGRGVAVATISISDTEPERPQRVPLWGKWLWIDRATAAVAIEGEWLRGTAAAGVPVPVRR